MKYVNIDYDFLMHLGNIILYFSNSSEIIIKLIIFKI